jgi:DNA-directed RNA polymerase subunit RPC12/RpoP
MVDSCIRCGRATPPTVVARDLERDSIVGGYRCAPCGASWFTSYRLSDDELAQSLAARRAAARA